MKLTNALNLPQPFVDAATSDHRYVDKRYSATAILKGTREAILQRRHDDEISNDVADMVWAIFGTAVHGILEQGEESQSQIKENKLVVDLPNGYQLSGIFDLYDDATGTVTDYKTASVWKVKFGCWDDWKPKADTDQFDDWRKQTLIYCWMLRQIGFDAHRGEIVALLKDHSKTKAKINEHPPLPVWQIGWDFTAEDFEQIEAWIMAKFEEIERCEKLPDEELPLCTEAERWTRPGKFAVMKKGRKSAVRLYDDKNDAYQRAAGENRNTSGEPFYVEERKGSDPKCMDYCSACEFCAYWQQTYGKEAQA